MLNDLRAEIHQRNATTFDQRAGERFGAQRRDFGSFKQRKPRNEAGHARAIRVVGRAEDLAQLAFFVQNRRPVRGEEEAAEDESHRETLETQARADEAEEAEEVEWITRNRERAFVDELTIFATGDI